MKRGHNDHLLVGIRIYTWKGSDPTGGWGAGPNVCQIVLNLNGFSSETTGHILMKLGHNDHLVVRIRIYTWKWSDPPGGLRAGSNSAKSSYDFSSETTVHIFMKLGHNDHLVMGIRIYTYKGSDPPGVLGVGSNSVLTSNDLSSETTGQILMRLGHNDHLVVWIIIDTCTW